MDSKLFENIKFNYDDIVEAVRYGYKYNEESQPEEGGIIPDGNIQQWITSTIKRSADEWQKLTPDIVVLDPDGWRDAESHKRAWYEDLITYQEYTQRRDQSTCQFKQKEEI